MIMNDVNVDNATFNDVVGRDWLRTLLKERVVTLTFLKTDGSERVMQATLSEEIVPKAVETAEPKKVRKISDEAQPVFDVEAQGWRSFRWDSVKKVEFSLGESA
jgi:hypothetical protein